MNIKRIKYFFCKKALDVLFPKNKLKIYPNHQTYWHTLKQGLISKRLENVLPHKEKVLVVPLKRREKDHNINYLLKNKLTGLYIDLRNGTTLDLLIHNKQAWDINRLKDSSKRLYHIKLGDSEILCSLKYTYVNNNNDTIYKISFERFIEGEENWINVDLKLLLSKNYLSPDLKEYNLKWYLKDIDLVTKIKDYPKEIYLDSEILLKNGKFLLGDLKNFLSKDWIIKDKRCKNLEYPIVKFDVYSNKRESIAFSKLQKIKGEKEVEEEVKKTDDINLNQFLANPSPSFNLSKSSTPKKYVKKVRSIKDRIEQDKKKLTWKIEPEPKKKK